MTRVGVWVIMLLCLASGVVFANESEIQSNSQKAFEHLVQGEYESALRYIRENQRIEPNNAEYVRQEAYIFDAWADALARDGQSESSSHRRRLAMNRYVDAIDLAHEWHLPSDYIAALYVQKSLVHRKIGDYPGAVRELQAALRLDPDHVYANYWLGDVLRRWELARDPSQPHEEMIESGSRYLRRAIELAPDAVLPYAYWWLGSDAYHEGDTETAMAFLTKWMRQIEMEVASRPATETDHFYYAMAQRMIEQMQKPH